MADLLVRDEKWDVDDQFALPPLGDIIVGAHVDHDTVEVTCTYYDTPDRDLQAHGRDGGDQLGWQLTEPARGSDRAVRWPLSDRVPAEVTRLLNGIRLGKELDAIATIRTQRRRHRRAARSLV